MDLKRVWIAVFTLALGAGAFLAPAYADDLSDGISEATDENIAADDNIGSNKANNINFIVVDAIGKSKSKRTKNAANRAGGCITNFNDGSMDNNTNSVVVESGSKVDKVYNIVIER